MMQKSERYQQMCKREREKGREIGLNLGAKGTELTLREKDRKEH